MFFNAIKDFEMELRAGMRIGMMTREYPPDTPWGGEAFGYRDLAVALAAKGHEVHIVCQAVGTSRDHIVDGIFVHQVGRDSSRYSARARLDYGVRAALRIRELVRQYRLEIVDGLYEGTDTLIYSFSKLTPLVIQVHGSIRQHIECSPGMPTFDRAKLKGLLFLSDTTARRADLVVALSPGAYEEMRRFVGVEQQKLKLVYHARDLARYQNKRSDFRRKLGLSVSAPLVLCVGRLEERKGVHILCQAVPSVLAVFPETKFLLLGMDTPSGPGGGSFKGFVSKQLQSRGAMGSTIFIDFLPDDELVQLYSACDLVVCPSLHEVASSVPLEAMACGKPVVATAVGLVPEIQLDGTNGETVPPGDPGALAAGIVSVLRIVSAGDKQRGHIAERNRRIVERRKSVAEWASEMAAIYHDVSYSSMSNNVKKRQ